ncbi:MAG: hypothetical protein BMS9Abin05_0318 [Rhodothermia bacterium]|nr:MAG: hypothetical protein BMS9Abin05_0318 [Rhodothermia bacterium]
MPEEILAIIIVSIAAVTTLSIIRMTLNYRARGGVSGTSEGSSMTTSELERMMRRAVEDATAPLTKKVEDLEFEIATRNRPQQLEEARKDLLNDLEDEQLQESSDPVPVKSRESS